MSRENTESRTGLSGPSDGESDKPLCIDLFCGLGGWTEGFLAEGFRCIGFDIEEHIYGEHRYPAQLVLQDVRTLHGSQFKNADIIVSSSPCQEFSYRAMPWKRAKALGTPVLGMELFAQAGRIQREACEAAGRYIPMIQENVRGAQPYVGRAQWHYGSYYLWGDVPALMPVTHKGVKVAGMNWSGSDKPGYKAVAFNDPRHSGMKNTGGSWFAIPGPGGIAANNNPDGRKVPSEAGRRTDVGNGARFTSREGKVEGKGKSRKAAAAKIAKIPFPLAQHIARVTHEAKRVA